MMSRTIKICIILSFFNPLLNGLSFVYNLRFSEISKARAPELTNVAPSTLGIAIFDQTRTRTTHIIQDNIAGGLASYMYSKDHFYLRADTAFANVRAKSNNYYFSRTQTDDFLITIGYGRPVSKKATITGSLLFGFPTHRDTSLEGITFGTGHNGFGIQIDGIFSPNKENLILVATRYIRFCPASIFYPVNDNYTHFVLDLGNLFDILIGYNHFFKSNVIECGYNPSFLFHAAITPEIPDRISQLNYIRSNFYGAYKRFFMRKPRPQAFIIAASYGFDNKPKIFKRIMTVWAVWGIMF